MNNNDALSVYMQRLRDWPHVESPPLSLLHRWEKELKLRDSDIRQVHQIALAHRRRGFELLREGKADFLAELREAIQLEPADPDFLKMILVELARHEYGGENWDLLLNKLFVRYPACSPDSEKAREELERLFPRIKLRKDHRPAVAIAAGIVLALLVSGTGLTIAWFALRQSPPPEVALTPPPGVDWSGLNNDNWDLVLPSFQRIDLGPDSWLVVQGRLSVTNNAWRELVLNLSVAEQAEGELRRFSLPLVSLSDPPFVPGQSLPFRWVIPVNPDATNVQAVIRVEKERYLEVQPRQDFHEEPAGNALSIAQILRKEETNDGQFYAIRDIRVRNAHTAPLKRLTLEAEWSAGGKVFWKETRQVLQPLDTPLPSGQTQAVRFYLKLSSALVPKGELDFQTSVVEEER